jgi:hypothetical protein
MIQARMGYAYRQRTMLSKNNGYGMTRKNGSGRSKAEPLEKTPAMSQSAKNITCREV